MSEIRDSPEEKAPLPGATLMLAARPKVGESATGLRGDSMGLVPTHQEGRHMNGQHVEEVQGWSLWIIGGTGAQIVPENDGYRCKGAGVCLCRVNSRHALEIEIDGIVTNGAAYGDMIHLEPGSFLRIRKAKPPASLVLSPEAISAARKETCVTVVSQERYDEGQFQFDGTLDAVIESLQSIRSSIPEEYREKAKCEIDSCGIYEDSHYAKIEVSYWRPETDAEVIHRLEQDAIRQQAATKKELDELDRLHRKYGGRGG